MTVPIGKHAGNSVVEVMLKDPEYVNWVLQTTGATGKLKLLQNKMQTFIDIFNSKSFTKKCVGQNCVKTATRCTAYKDNFNGLHWWCDNCDPYQSGARRGTLHPISTYEDVLYYVHLFCNNRTSDSISLIKQMAHEKGLPQRVKKGDIDKFFLEKGILTF